MFEKIQINKIWFYSSFIRIKYYVFSSIDILCILYRNYDILVIILVAEFMSK